LLIVIPINNGMPFTIAIAGDQKIVSKDKKGYG